MSRFNCRIYFRWNSKLLSLLYFGFLHFYACSFASMVVKYHALYHATWSLCHLYFNLLPDMFFGFVPQDLALEEKIEKERRKRTRLNIPLCDLSLNQNPQKQPKKAIWNILDDSSEDSSGASDEPIDINSLKKDYKKRVYRCSSIQFGNGQAKFCC